MTDEICTHEHVVREVVLGIASGDKQCTKCGALFTSSEELKKARAAASVLNKNQTPKEVVVP